MRFRLGRDGQGAVIGGGVTVHKEQHPVSVIGGLITCTCMYTHYNTYMYIVYTNTCIHVCTLMYTFFVTCILRLLNEMGDVEYAGLWPNCLESIRRACQRDRRMQKEKKKEETEVNSTYMYISMDLER